MISFTKKIIVCALLGVMTLTPFIRVQALVAPVLPIDPAHEIIKRTQVPVRGLEYNRLTSPFWIEFTASKLACDALIFAAEANNVTQANTGWLGIGFSLIGGDPLEMTKNEASILAITAAQECIQDKIMFAGINYKSSGSAEEATDLSREMTYYEGINTNFTKRLQDLNAIQSASTEQFLGALLTKIALGVTQNLTNEVIDGLIAQYKISDFSKYADTLGTQLYTMNYINDNFSGNQQEQLLIRAIAQASFDNAPQRVSVATNYAQTLAEEQAGCARGKLALNDPNFYSAFAASGRVGCDPLDHLLKGQELAGVAKAAGQTAALNEINTGQGFIPVRSCGAGLAQQQAFDNEQQSVSDQIGVVRQAIKIINQSNASIDQKRTELAKANTELAALKTKLDTLRSQQAGEATKSICEAIESPGSFIAKSIDQYLGGFLNNSMTLKSDNLPYALSFLGDLATNFVTDLITGAGDSDSTLLTEEGVGNLRSGTAPITFSQTFDPSTPLTNYGVEVPGGNPGGGGGGGNGNGGGGGNGTPTAQDVCIPEPDGELIVDCGNSPENIPQAIGDIFNVRIRFPEKPGEMELSSASLQADPSDPDGAPTIQEDGEPVSFDVEGTEEQPLREQFEVTSLFTIISVKFTPEDGSQVLVASLAIALPELTEPDPGLPNQNGGSGNGGEVLGATDSGTLFRSSVTPVQKKSGITLR